MKTGRVVFSAMAALVLWGAGGAAVAAPPVIELENMRVGFSDRFEVGRWAPVWITLKAGDEGFRGILELAVPDDEDTPAATARGFEIGPGQTRMITMYARPGTPLSDGWRLRAISESGRGYRLEIPAEVSGSFSPLDNSETILVSLGSLPGIEQISGLPGFRETDPAASAAPQPTRPGVPYVFNSQTNKTRTVLISQHTGGSMLPNRSIGYETAEAVLINANDKTVMAELDSGKSAPLIEWVRGGGKLVIAVGSNWQGLKDSSLARILPAELAGTEQVSDLNWLESYAPGAKSQITPAGGAKVTIVSMKPLASHGCRALDAGTTTPVVMRGHFGFGVVTLIGLSVDEKPFAAWQDRNAFWAKTLNLKGAPLDANGAPLGGAVGQFGGMPSNDFATDLHTHLERFPAVKLVPFGWVAFFIFLYILLIGPGDYFFLRKVLKRMELTWVTFPLMVLAVSLLAYAAAYAIKGTDLRVNAIDAVDIDQSSDPESPTKPLRGRTWCTLFSPRNEDYDVALDPRPIEGEPADRPDTGKSSASSSERVVTWFGVPESSFGGMNNGNRWSPFSSGYAYAPLGELESLKGVRVPIWSTRSFVGSWTDRTKPIVESDISASNEYRAEGSIKNLLAKPLKNAQLVFGSQIYTLGEIGPGKAVTLKEKGKQSLQTFLSRESSTATTNRQPDDPSVVGRAETIRVIWFHSSLGDSAPKPSRQFRDLDMSAHLALDRPMLLAELEGSLAGLDLGSAGASAKMERTTLIRVLLPAPAAEAAGSP